MKSRGNRRARFEGDEPETAVKFRGNSRARFDKTGRRAAGAWKPGEFVTPEEARTRTRRAFGKMAYSRAKTRARFARDDPEEVKQKARAACAEAKAMWEHLRGGVAHSTNERSGAEAIREVQAYIEEHGRPPRSSSSLVGTAEYKLRCKVRRQVKTGRFSEEERSELAQLLGNSASAGYLHD